MNLGVENFYQLGQGELQNWNWFCEKIYQDNAYLYETNLTLNEVYNIANNGWLIQSFQGKVAPDSFDVLFVKKTTENCYWKYTGEGELPAYTLLATPIKDAETQPAWAFLIEKNWTYGEITTNILLFLVLGIFVWDMLRRMFKTKF